MSNRKSYDLIEAPATEPVSLSDVKTFLRIDGNENDAILNILIASARRTAEEYTKRAFITQTWRLSMDSFCVDDGVVRPPFIPQGHSIQLSRQPIQSITSITTVDSAGTSLTVPPSTYTLDTASGRILLNALKSWPSDLRSEAAIVITFIAGWDSSANVPAPIHQGILQHVAASYSSKVCADIPAGAKSLYDGFRLPEAFGAV
jgi:uncharacterized phiE125 gp8 family phage protein